MEIKKYIICLFIIGINCQFLIAQIEGPTAVCAGANSYMYHISGNTTGTVSWSHSSGATFVAGQGTNAVTVVFTDVASTADGYGVTDGNSSVGGTIQAVATVNGASQTYTLAITFLDDETCNECYCYDDLHVNSSLISVQDSTVFQAENRLSSNGDVMLGDTVTYRAGTRVALEPGFIADEGSKFIAYTDPCKTEGKNISPFEYCQTDNNPIGGGPGYNQIVTPQDADIYITQFTTITNFKNTIETASLGSVIYIADNLVINLTGQYAQTGDVSIGIPAGVTLASGRGNGSQGALIYTDDFDWYTSIDYEGMPAFTCLGDNIRFTGIRFKGPFHGIGTNNPLSSIRFKTGIRTNGYDHLEIDNCELYDWPYAAIGLFSGSLDNNKIHHNYFHHNRQHGLGYGVVIDLAYATIYSNLMHSNRHVIAGSGKDGSGYEAYCNTVLSGGTSHNFDMHAEGPSDGTPNAGDFIYIHHNDFHDVGEERVNGNNDQNIYIRGRPDKICRIENNRFKHSDPASAIKQRNPVGGYGNVLVFNNIWGGFDYRGWYVKEEWDPVSPFNFLTIESTTETIYTPGPGTLYQYNYFFGDKDGDGKTDIMKLENGLIWHLPLEITDGMNTDWVSSISTGYSFNSLRFGNYDSNPATDLIRKDGGNIVASYNLATSWTTHLTTGYSLNQLLEGDFYGDGQLDFLYPTGSAWLVSNNTNTSWQTLSNSSQGNVLIGHFNSDGKSDVFWGSGGQWYYSNGGSGAAQSLASSGTTALDLVLGDLNNDGISDVIFMQNMQVSLSGSSSWKSMNVITIPRDVFTYGDLE